MFIDKLMREIWLSYTEDYTKAYNTAMLKSVNELENFFKNEKISYYQYPDISMTNIASCGCPHRYSNKYLSGCSMCDYHSDRVVQQGMLTALKEKSPKAYANVLKRSFKNIRGIKPQPSKYELLSGFDSLNSEEFPDEVIEDLYGSVDELFKERPYCYLIETRVSSVTSDRLKKLRESLKQRSRIIFGVGIEVGNEWVRNHWINKSIKNFEIKNAITLIKRSGFLLAADVLIGIPGLTEEQSIKLFKESLFYLDSIGINNFVCLPLNRKKVTLQGYIYNNLKNNEKLLDVGLAQEEHTCVPWLFTIVRALCELFSERPDLIKKVLLAQLSAQTNSVKNVTAYNMDKNCKCLKIFNTALENFRDGDIDSLFKLEIKMKDDPCYEKYLELLEKQKKAGDILNTLSIIGKELAKVTWQDNYEIYFESFIQEMKSYTK